MGRRDLTNAQWAKLEPLLPAGKKSRRPPVHTKRQLIDAYFAFTATPKNKTLELFGRNGADGKPREFHLYSMKQAIVGDHRASYAVQGRPRTA
ncbi:transposase [Streptomyces sparsogenes]|uniref:Uncharacterized protein n=1 Tax=Streptomyces sparsogenes DSM 40356 TaxID=1331668 RepID=A0A1R1SFP1_9ACTN|nr:transposase [Streptomyces sparsogenes]OMI37056.1 hypothetical protein SPAR_23129 [Streptomyces sparsogenes DSM 40356]